MRTAGILRVQAVEESKTEVFLTAKADNPMQKREQFVLDQRKANRREKISKKRQNLASNHREVEEVGPFPEQLIYDFDHCCEFLAGHPEVS